MFMKTRSGAVQKKSERDRKSRPKKCDALGLDATAGKMRWRR